MVGLIHLESHFTDEKAGLLRAETYQRLRRHWQFINELELFEIQHQKRYGINIYASSQDPNFVQAASLYHPDTVVNSLMHNGIGPEPGIKDPDGNWDLRPHLGRIVHVTSDTLQAWHAVLESDDVPTIQTRMVYAVNKATAAVLDKLAAAPRIGSLELQFSRGWDESIDRKKGFFDTEWGAPESWDEVILQGSHLSVARPLYKYPNPTMLHNTDWTEVDLENLAPDAIPVTSYKPRGTRAHYDAAYTHWTSESGGLDPARDHYRLAWRRMAANTGERTLIPAIIPPGASHVDGVFSAGFPRNPRLLPVVVATVGSLSLDFMTRVAPKGDIRAPQFNRLPVIEFDGVLDAIALRALRLNCLTTAYSELWRECFIADFCSDTWTSASGLMGSHRQIGHGSREWTPQLPLRIAFERRQAMIEIDALVALGLNLTADELCTIYRTQFPVLYGYDRNTNLYDANGRLVPSSVVSLWRARGQNDGQFTVDDLTAVHPGSAVAYVYVLPFATLDRERDLRVAYAEFERRIANRC